MPKAREESDAQRVARMTAFGWDNPTSELAKMRAEGFTETECQASRFYKAIAVLYPAQNIALDLSKLIPPINP